MSYRWKNNCPKARDGGSSSIITYTSDHPSSHQVDQSSKNKGLSDQQTTVRSRWSPKPEQILILESVFNSGMVNPPKDETMRIRMLLENYGPVGDANVFYWFQNRRSRTRRLQRQIQANTTNAQNTLHCYNQSSNLNNAPFLIPSLLDQAQSDSASSYSCLNAGFSSNAATYEGFHDSGSVAYKQPDASSPVFNLSDDVTYNCSYMQYQQQDDQGRFVTVFINGVATEVPMGQVDMKEIICGDTKDYVLLHSSGNQVHINEYGFSTYSLQHGESYFLVDKSM